MGTKQKILNIGWRWWGKFRLQRHVHCSRFGYCQVMYVKCLKAHIHTCLKTYIYNFWDGSFLHCFGVLNVTVHCTCTIFKRPVCRDCGRLGCVQEVFPNSASLLVTFSVCWQPEPVDQVPSLSAMPTITHQGLFKVRDPSLCFDFLPQSKDIHRCQCRVAINWCLVRGGTRIHPLAPETDPSNPQCRW